MTQWTIKKLLDWVVGYFTEKHLDSPRLSAEILLSYALNLKRIELYAYFDRIVEQTKLDELRGLVKRAAEHEPVQYLTGRTEFYSLELKVSPNCLIPRPETELLVEKAIEFLRKRGGSQYVCDLCTGSGCVAVAVAKNYPDCKIVATDICDKALAVAAENVERYKLGEKIQLLCGDLFEPVLKGLDKTKFDLILANPPYVGRDEWESLEKNVKDFEPRLALDGGPDGLDIYRRIVGRIGEHLAEDCAVMFECGCKQGSAVCDLLKSTGLFGGVKIEKDLNGSDRVIIAVKS